MPKIKKLSNDEWDDEWGNDQERSNATLIEIVLKVEPDLLTHLPENYTQKDIDRLSGAFWCRVFNTAGHNPPQGYGRLSKSKYRKHLESLKPYLTDEDIEQAMQRVSGVMKD